MPAVTSGSSLSGFLTAQEDSFSVNITSSTVASYLIPAGVSTETLSVFFCSKSIRVAAFAAAAAQLPVVNPRFKSLVFIH